METQPKKFPREVRDSPDDIIPRWEESTWSNERAAETFDFFYGVLLRNGIDLKNKYIKVLEVGSGNAILLNYIKEQGVNAVGVDARPRGTNESPQVLARIEQLPFIDGQFDVVLANGGVFYPSYRQYENLMMIEISRVLKQGGMYMGDKYEERRYGPPEKYGLNTVKEWPSTYLFRKL